jgi:flavin reductase (DIM6/NTAB) family NADH-FMN oxidoreductase RutF
LFCCYQASLSIPFSALGLTGLLSPYFRNIILSSGELFLPVSRDRSAEQSACFIVFKQIMKQFSLADLDQLERFYRANLINCLTGFKSPVLIGTVNSQGQENLAIFNNLVHLGANPALVGFVNRPREAAPHTLANIEATGVYTMNHVCTSFIQPAHQTSAKYPEGESEFVQTGLSPVKRGDCAAPFVAESPVQFALQVKEIIPITFNNTFFVIGAITAIYVADELVEADGCIDLQKAGVVASLGIDSYYSVHKEAKLAYAKPAPTR